MIGPGDVMRWLVAALIADNELVTWCRQTFGRAALLQVGDDPESDPQQWRVPAIVLTPEPWRGGQAQSSQEVSVVCEVRARYEKRTATGGPESPLVQFDGVYLIDEFCAKVVGVIERRLRTTHVCLDPAISMQSNTTTLYPILVGEIRLSLTIPALIGAEPTLE